MLISMVSGIFVLALTFDPCTIHGLRSVKHEYIVAAICIHALSFLVWAMRLRGLCKTFGYDLRIKRALEIVASSILVAAITPSSMGGEPLRIHLLHKDDVPLGVASAVVIVERLLDAVLILSIAPASLFVYRHVLDDPALDNVLAMTAFLLILVLALVFYAIWQPQATRKLIMFFVKRMAPVFGARTDARLESITKRIDTELENFHGSMFQFMRKEKRKGLIIGMFNTILYWGVEFSMLYVILLGLNQHPSIILLVAAQVIVSLLMVLPTTPGASGVAELSATTVFSVFVCPSLLGVTVVVWRALSFYMNLLVGGFVSFKIMKDTEMMKKLLR